MTSTTDNWCSPALISWFMATQDKERPLTGSQDFLSYYGLIPLYDKYVRGTALDQTLHSFVADLPGKITLDDSDRLIDLLRNPQFVESGPDMRLLDEDTLRDAYSLKEGPIPNFDASILGTEDDPAGPMALDGFASTDGEERKHKKKKKKRKHSHEHDDGSHSHGEHKKKRKRKKEKDGHRGDPEAESVVID